MHNIVGCLEPSEVVLEPRRVRSGRRRTIQGRGRHCERGGGEEIAIVECHHIRHHRSAGLRGRDVVFTLVGRRMWTKTPTARGSGETRAAIVEWHGEGGCVVDRCRGWAWLGGAAANGAGEQSFVHPPHVAVHCVGPSGCMLMVFAEVGASGAGVVVIDVATMSVAVVPIFPLLDRRRGWLQHAGGSIVATVAAVVSTAATGVGCAAVVGRGNTTGGVAAAAPSVVRSAAMTTVTPAARVASLAGGLLELDHSGGGRLPMMLQSIWSCGCSALMEALLERRDSWVAAYAAPKLLTASVYNAVEASLLAAAIP
jgi:hypothetical protein